MIRRLFFAFLIGFIIFVVCLVGKLCDSPRIVSFIDNYTAFVGGIFK